MCGTPLSRYRCLLNDCMISAHKRNTDCLGYGVPRRNRQLASWNSWETTQVLCGVQTALELRVNDPGRAPTSGGMLSSESELSS